MIRPYDVKSLADFKRFLAQPGVSLIGVEHPMIGKDDAASALGKRLNPDYEKAFLSARPIEKVGSTYFTLKNPDGRTPRMDFGKASEWTFWDGHARHTQPPTEYSKHTRPEGRSITYRMEIEE